MKPPIPVDSFQPYQSDAPGANLAIGFSGGRVMHVFLREPEASRAIGELQRIVASTHRSEDNPSPTISFETTSAATVQMAGNGSAGYLMFNFFTPDGLSYATTIGPKLAAQLANNLTSSLSQMAIPPGSWQAPGPINSPLSGRGTANDSVTYFGQNYPRKIVELFGIIMIRAHLLDRAFIGLLAHVLSCPVAQSEAMLLSSTNNKARLDLVAAATRASDLPESRKGNISTYIDRAMSISRQRNVLVHGDWKLSGDKFSVSGAGLASKKKQDIVVSEKSLTLLAQAYHDLSAEIVMDLATIPVDGMASNISDTASPG